MDYLLCAAYCKQHRVEEVALGWPHYIQSKLHFIFEFMSPAVLTHSLDNSIEEGEVAEHHREPLEEHAGGSAVVEVVHRHNEGVHKGSHLGEQPFKPSKEGRVVQSPF